MARSERAGAMMDALLLVIVIGVIALATDIAVPNLDDPEPAR